MDTTTAALSLQLYTTDDVDANQAHQKSASMEESKQASTNQEKKGTAPTSRDIPSGTTGNVGTKRYQEHIHGMYTRNKNKKRRREEIHQKKIKRNHSLHQIGIVNKLLVAGHHRK